MIQFTRRGTQIDVSVFVIRLLSTRVAQTVHGMTKYALAVALTESSNAAREKGNYSTRPTVYANVRHLGLCAAPTKHSLRRTALVCDISFKSVLFLS